MRLAFHRRYLAESSLSPRAPTIDIHSLPLNLPPTAEGGAPQSLPALVSTVVALLGMDQDSGALPPSGLCAAHLALLVLPGKQCSSASASDLASLQAV